MMGKNVTATRDASGAVTGLIAGDETPLIVRPSSLSCRRVIAIGDSITLSDNDNTNGVVGESWFEFLCLLSMGRLRRVRNASVSGNTTAMMLSRLQADVIDYRPDICFIHGGTNDAGLSISISTTMANIDAMVIALLSAGIEPVLCLLPPRSSNQIATELINIRLIDYASRNRVRLIAPWRMMSNSSGAWLSSTYSVDGLHPTIYANHAAATDVLSQLSLSDVYPFLPRNNTDTNGVIASNTLFATDTNADGLPDSWIKYGATVTPSLVAGTGDVVGNWLNLAFSGITGAGIVERSLSVGSGYSVGDTIAIIGRVKSNGLAAGTASANVKVNFINGGRNVQPLNLKGIDVSDGIFYQETTVPVGTTQINIDLISGNYPTTGTGDWSVSQMQIYNLTALGIDG